MSQLVKVSLRDKSYRIVIGHNILKDIGQELKALNLGNEAIIVTHPVLKRLHGKSLVSGLASSGIGAKFLEVAEGESSKSTKTFVSLLEKVARQQVNKNIFIIAFGGGVVGDLAGFVAAVYRRGIPYVQVPTTLLAQIDSAIGGKTAIDLSVGKNLAGAFYQPALVYSDTAVLATLNKRQIRNGLAEAVKYGIISDHRLFDYIARNVAKLLTSDVKVLSEVVYQCSRIKARVVEQDEKETKGIRTILNFGHTVGHAVEAAGKFSKFQHGEAVALGMRIAAELSVRMKYLTAKEAAVLGGLLTEIGLPERINPTARKSIALPQIIGHMMHDKKFKAGQPRFVLATALGSVKVVDGIPMSEIKSAIQAYL